MEFFKKLSEEEWDQAEAIEKELANTLAEGMSEEVGPLFVRTVMELRAKGIDTNVSGALEQVMQYGLLSVRYALGLAVPMAPKKTGKQARSRNRLSGNRLTAK